MRRIIVYLGLNLLVTTTVVLFLHSTLHADTGPELLGVDSVANPVAGKIKDKPITGSSRKFGPIQTNGPTVPPTTSPTPSADPSPAPSTAHSTDPSTAPSTAPEPDFRWSFGELDFRNCVNRWAIWRQATRSYVCVDTIGQIVTDDKCPPIKYSQFTQDCPKRKTLFVGIEGGCGTFIPLDSHHIEVVSGCHNATSHCKLKCADEYPITIHGHETIECKHDNYADNKAWTPVPLKCTDVEESDEDEMIFDESPEKEEYILADEFLPPVRLTRSAFYSYTHRDGRVTVERVKLRGAENWETGVKVILPAGNYTLRYDGGAWNYAFGRVGKWSTSGFEITANGLQSDHVTNVYRAPPADIDHEITEDGLKPHTLGFVNLDETKELTFKLIEPNERLDSNTNKGEIILTLYIFQRGCGPIPGIIRPDFDLKRLLDVSTPRGNGNWKWCCKQCAKTRGCRAWDYRFGNRICELKHRIANDTIPPQGMETMAGFKPTGIPWSSKRHEPTKLMIVAHPDDEVIFGGQALADGFHENLFNDWYVVTTTAEDLFSRKMDQRDAMEYVHAGYEIWNYQDKFCVPRYTCVAAYWNQIKDIAAVLREREWTDIMTHNILGEYGHPMHGGANIVVERLWRAIIPSANLWVFHPRPDHELFEVNHYNRRLPASYLGKVKLELMDIYSRYVGRTGYYKPWVDEAVLIQDYNITHSQNVCETYGQGFGNQCCLANCVGQEVDEMLVELGF